MLLLYFLTLFNITLLTNEQNACGYIVINRISMKTDFRFAVGEDYVRKHSVKTDTVKDTSIIKMMQKIITSKSKPYKGHFDDVRIVVDMYSTENKRIQSFYVLSNRLIKIDQNCYPRNKKLEKILGIYRRERKLQRQIEKIFPPVWKIE